MNSGSYLLNRPSVIGVGHFSTQPAYPGHTVWSLIGTLINN